MDHGIAAGYEKECARVAELVDATDLKSVVLNRMCRFDSGREHHIPQPPMGGWGMCMLGNGLDRTAGSTNFQEENLEIER